VARKRGVEKSANSAVHRLKGRRKGAVLKEQTWYEDGKLVAYSLAYVNLKVSRVDNGRVLGYDNSHSHHHRHFMGRVEPIDFAGYPALVERFLAEVHELWRIEDEEA